MNIDINISGQEEGKFKTFYLVLGIVGLIYLTLSFIRPEMKINYVLWIVFLPGFVESILYGLGKKRIFADNLPYLRINEDKIETSKGGLFSKPKEFYWSNVKNIDIKLFEIHLTTTDNTQSVIELSNLTDENLKIVKEFVFNIKKEKEQKDIKTTA